MAVAFRAAGTLVESSTASLVVPYPAGVAAGDLLLIQYACATTAPTTPSGWTALFGGGTFGSDGQGDRFNVYYRVAGGSEPSSVTFTKPANVAAGIMIAYSGVNTTTPIDASATAVLPTSGTSATTPSVTTTQANTMLVRLYWAWVSGSPDITPAATDTERYDTLFATHAYKMELADHAQAASGATGTTTATFPASTLFGGLGATIAAAPLAAPLNRPATNYIAGTGITIAAADNPTLDAVDVTIASTVTTSGLIPAAIVDVKGDLIAATAADTVARLAAGTNGQLLAADNTQTTGLRWTTVTVPPTVTYGTTPPGSPADGDLWYFPADTTNGVLWAFRYRAGSASTYKWEFVGGPPLANEVYTLESTASATYADLTTVGPQVTLPRNGDYDLHFGASGFSSTATPTGLRVAVKIAAIATGDNESFIISSNVASFEQSSARWFRIPARTAGDVAKLQYLTTAAVSASFRRRWLHCLPIRVA